MFSLTVSQNGTSYFMAISKEIKKTWTLGSPNLLRRRSICQYLDRSRSAGALALVMAGMRPAKDLPGLWFRFWFRPRAVDQTIHSYLALPKRPAMTVGPLVMKCQHDMWACLNFFKALRVYPKLSPCNGETEAQPMDLGGMVWWSGLNLATPQGFC